MCKLQDDMVAILFLLASCRKGCNLMGYNKNFRFESLRRRHQNAPMLEERFEYLRYLRDKGTSPRQIHRIASWLITIIEHLNFDTSSTVTISAIENAAIQWREKVEISRTSPIQQQIFDEFRRKGTNWLRYRGARIEKPPTALSLW
jgi:hypothetical protein